MHKKNISEDRKKYLHKIFINKVIVIITRLTIIIGIIVLWEILANRGIIDSFIMSSPSRMLKTFINLSSSNELAKHLNTTIMETLVGFSLGTAMGSLIAVLLWWSKFLSKVLEPFLVVLNSLPKVALRTNIYNLGRSRCSSNYCYGNSNFIGCYNYGDTKWIYRNR